MCGLAGYFYLDHRKEQCTTTIKEMIDLQKHRGPDDSGILAINTKDELMVSYGKENQKMARPCDLLFGFNRLSILDLSFNGHQPMVSEKNKVALMLNGEIYNAFDYKDDLTTKGYNFKSTTDTEVVLNLYLEYGMDGMIKRLNGMFAIVVWDMRIKKLFLARDRFGIKPLYILKQNGRISFSSEMKSFGVLPEFSFELDKTKLDEFLLFRNVINDTLFKNIRNCKPGSYLSVSQTGDIKEHIFYDINEEGADLKSKKDALNDLERSLQRSVQRQMISDVKLGCQLSGGVDSSLVAYYAKKSLEEGRLETISIKFSNPLFSEERYIDFVARQLELIAHKYTMEGEYYFNELEKATWHFEQPLNHPNTIGIYLLSQEAKKHVTVLLSGEGADEALAGYRRFINNIQSPYFNRHFLSKLKQNLPNLLSFLRYYNDGNCRLIMESSFSSIYSANELYPEFDSKLAFEKRKSILDKLDGDPILKHRKYELLTYLPDLLMRQDKMSMAHSIENRVPFLDNEMVTSSLNIAGDELIGSKNGRTEAKMILKVLCSKNFGNDFAFRRKKGFGIPLKDFMSSTDFQNRWKDEIEPGIEERGIFEVDSVSKWVSKIEKANSAQLDAIWLMTGFEIWAKKYLD
ncbi:asparagine synthase (glutamine-hydrolyzing) [Balneolaceae bacterium YR4-1]|uniref:asparagine synthase (glutamine-hydrolyzing) n=1 Tax=Halalkalibaculum roseum TaxID=2709311 RepID=A0A6M1T3W2_9BACT|nr:asparagine synthase (glutamine-hydrolyzing) [Halalkalibaculum roseum]NGP78154.1 asparagine synthase (glutamine-hydrolyzing) [Halalkalibaculum roseum]